MHTQFGHIVAQFSEIFGLLAVDRGPETPRIESRPKTMSTYPFEHGVDFRRPTSSTCDPVAWVDLSLRRSSLGAHRKSRENRSPRPTASDFLILVRGTRVRVVCLVVVFGRYGGGDLAMSPASSGTLEVERYIGACLISSKKSERFQPRERFVYNGYVSRYQQQCGVDGWAGGVPLISYHRKEEHHIPLARLAVHTQGAPLVLSNRCSNRRRNKVQNLTPVARVTDAVSVASDESSGNSETCLPRIIKPRKRRKKDRKTPQLGRPLSQDGFSTDSASPDIIDSLLPSVQPCFSFPNKPPVGDTETPELHHRFEDVKEADQTSTNCQCSYCDPSNLIWDVDRSCYSPFLTPKDAYGFPKFDLVHGMSSVSLEEQKSARSSSPRDLEVSTEIVTSPNGHRDIEIKFFLPSSLEVEVLGKGVVKAADFDCRLTAEE